MIGGSDIVLWIPDHAPAADVIMRIVRQHWPGFVFQNADDDEPIDPAKLASLPQPTGREFFLYRSMAAAMDWSQSGATQENKNSLIYVILGNRRKPDLGLRSITLVGGEWTGELAPILAEIRLAFEDWTKYPTGNHLPTIGPVSRAAERE
jgi:hypothetical protein